MPLYAVSALVFMGIALISFVLLYLFLPGKGILETRLAGMAPKPEVTGSLQSRPGRWQRFLGRVGGKLPLRPQDYGKYTRNLLAAGIRKEMFPVFMGSKVLLAAGLPAAYLLFYGIPMAHDRAAAVIIAAAIGIAGFLAPSYWLTVKRRGRQLRMFHDLPDVLDLMTVCVEAGLSMDAAILKIAVDRQFRESPLARELKILTQETRAGKPRHDALKDLGERAMLDDLRSFSSMLIQTEQLGTSLAHSLRVHSDSLRTIRRQRAEEAAAKTSVKLLFPLVFFIMPSMFVVILLPGLIRLSEFFAKI